MTANRVWSFEPGNCHGCSGVPGQGCDYPDCRVEIDAAGGASFQVVFTLYEPRWHGWARWDVEQYEWFEGRAWVRVTTIEKGWTRRASGSRVLHIDSARRKRLGRSEDAS